jgi:hypothetical protein
MTDTPQVLLAHHLKALKLPTILREYDKIARQCAAEGVDYPRYLLRLVEAEIIEREQRMVDRRIKAAKFPTVKSIDSFDFAAAGAVIAAHNGATPHQFMAIFGWRTLKEAERYTRAADQKRIASGAMRLLIADRSGNESG